MIRIALVDDDSLICDLLHNYLIDYEVKYNFEFEKSVFMSCESLLLSIEEQKNYDLIFLDIEFPKMNGIDLSHVIRDLLNDSRTQIIFISSKESYAMQLFKVQPFDFIVKPFGRKQIFQCISKYIKQYVNSNMFFTYSLDKIKHKIAVGEIMYIQSKGKKLNLYTINDVISCYYKFSDAIESEMKNSMIVIKRGTAVNIHHIIETDFETVILTGGIRLKISTGYQEKVMDILSDKIGGI